MIVVFEKGYALRHIGHLDLMRTIQRALRRTTLPIRYSKGFSPHIQLSFAAPLSVGVVGAREVMDVPMETDVAGDAFAAAMNHVLPQSLRVLAARPVADDFPTLMAMVAASRIRVDIDGGPAAEKVAAVFPRFMEGGECVTLRKTKAGENMTNIRPFVLEAELVQTEGGYALRALIENRKEGSLKPAVLMQALCEQANIGSVPFVATRECILAKQDNALIRLEDYNHG
jgi:radical SAM-linked protein